MNLANLYKVNLVLKFISMHAFSIKPASFKTRLSNAYEQYNFWSTSWLVGLPCYLIQYYEHLPLVRRLQVIRSLTQRLPRTTDFFL